MSPIRVSATRVGPEIWSRGMFGFESEELINAASTRRVSKRSSVVFHSVTKGFCIDSGALRRVAC